MADDGRRLNASILERITGKLLVVGLQRETRIMSYGGGADEVSSSSMVEDDAISSLENGWRRRRRSRSMVKECGRKECQWQDFTFQAETSLFRWA